jgi:hypothetical protein
MRNKSNNKYEIDVDNDNNNNNNNNLLFKLDPSPVCCSHDNDSLNISFHADG